MKKTVSAIWIGMTLLSGCGNTAPPAAEPRGEMRKDSFTLTGSSEKPATGPVQVASIAAPAPSIGSSGPTPAMPTYSGMNEAVAMVNGEPLTMGQLVKPLMEAHGLTILLNLVQLELARQDAARFHIVVTSKDFEDERRLTMDRLFKGSDSPKLVDDLDKAVAEKREADAAKIRDEINSDRKEYLEQFLANQHLDPVEFEIVLQINAYLRRIAEPQMAGKINNQAVHNAFGQMFGEKVHVHYIELANMNEVGDAKRRLANGDSFEEVARDMSRNRASADLGGDLPAFTRQSQNPPQNFKDVAFGLRDGEVSEVVVLGNTFILIKRIELIPPKVVKFEDVKDHVFQVLHDRLLESAVKKLKEDLAIQAGKNLVINEPVLKQQFEDRKHRLEQEAEKRAKEDLARQGQMQGGSAPRKLSLQERIQIMDPKQRTTLPATTEAAPSQAEAAPAAAGERPPATQPGSANVLELPRLTPDNVPAVTPRSSQ